MKLGAAFLTYQQGAAADGGFERTVARHADQVGLHSVWFSEHHFSADGYLPSAVPAMADILARTGRIGVGVGVALLPFHDIARLDAGLRVLERFDRPVLYAAGVGYRDEEFDGFGLRRRDRGRIFEARLGELATRLRARGSPTELWVGAIATVAVRRAARFGLPVLLPPGSTDRELRRRRQSYHEIAGNHGRFGVVRDVVLGATTDDAQRAFEALAVPMYRDYLHHMVITTAAGPVWGHALGAADTEAYFARMRANTLLGDAATVRAAVAGLADAGVELAVLRCWYPGDTPDAGVAALDRLATAVAGLS